MSKSNELLPETWHEYQQQISLDWMAEEYFGNLAEHNRKKFLYDKTEKQEKYTHLESERTYLQTPHESHKTQQRVSRTRQEGNVASSKEVKDDLEETV